MRIRTVSLLSALALIIGAAACQQLPSPVSTTRGPLQTEELAFADAIPLEYGALVGVTALPDYPYTAGLWFEKPDKTIVLVKVNVSLGKMEKKALVLPRR